jgi:hypothetical protein
MIVAMIVFAYIVGLFFRPPDMSAELAKARVQLKALDQYREITDRAIRSIRMGRRDEAEDLLRSGFKDARIAGIIPDRGLFMPSVGEILFYALVEQSGRAEETQTMRQYLKENYPKYDLAEAAFWLRLESQQRPATQPPSRSGVDAQP